MTSIKIIKDFGGTVLSVNYLNIIVGTLALIVSSTDFTSNQTNVSDHSPHQDMLTDVRSPDEKAPI